MQRIMIIKEFGVQEFEGAVNKFLEKLYELGVDSDYIYLEYMYVDRAFICIIQWEIVSN